MKIQLCLSSQNFQLTLLHPCSSHDVMHQPRFPASGSVRICKPKVTRAAAGTWRARGGGNAGGGVQTVRVQVYWKPCGILTAGRRLSLRPLWGGRRGAPGRGTRWVLRTPNRDGREYCQTQRGRSYTRASCQPVPMSGDGTLLLTSYCPNVGHTDWNSHCVSFANGSCVLQSFLKWMVTCCRVLARSTCSVHKGQDLLLILQGRDSKLCPLFSLESYEP